MMNKKILLSESHPELVDQFMVDKNNGKLLDNFSSGSSEKVWWECKEGHQWQTRVNHRTRSKSGCPYCSGRLPTLETCLATIYPISLQFWDEKKNASLTPFDVKVKTNKKVWWKCENNHSWQASPANFTHGNRCPFCSNKIVTEETSILFTNPELIQEWDYENNVTVLPSQLSSGSGKKVWWKCAKGHTWENSPHSRVSNNSGCPYCSNKKVSKDNNLLIKFPDIAKEWDTDKNGNLKPDQIVFGSSKNVHWKCSRGHTWTTTVSSRTFGGTNCPYCNPNISKLELRIFSELYYFFPDTDRQRKIWSKEFDISNKIYKFCIEVDGYPWHLNKIENDTKKNELCQQHGFYLIRVRDEKLGPLGDNNIFYKESKSENHLTTTKKVFRLLIKNISLSFELKTRLQSYELQTEFVNESFYNRLISELPGPGHDRSIEITHPKIAKQFHPFKNGNLMPNMVSIGSGMRLWWLCDKGHEWEAYVYARQNGGCPYCSNFKVNASNSLQTLFPEIAKEWHPTKNGLLTPNDVVAGSGKKVWWLCSKGHEWYRAIERSTKLKRKCPYCEGKLLPDTSKYPN